MSNVQLQVLKPEEASRSGEERYSEAVEGMKRLISWQPSPTSTSEK